MVMTEKNHKRKKCPSLGKFPPILENVGIFSSSISFSPPPLLLLYIYNLPTLKG
jgi:hypothetical protein